MTARGQSLADVRGEIDVEGRLAGFKAATDDERSRIVEQLYRHYKPLALRYARRNNAFDTEAIVDLALFDTFRALPDMRRANDHTFRRYLFRAVRSHTITESRRAVPVPADIGDHQIASAPGFEPEVLGRIRFDELVGQLPHDQRAVIVHRFVDGLSAEETGRILGKKANAVYQLQHRATRRLHRLLLAGAVLLLVALTIIGLRQANQYRVDSTPARPEPTPESTTELDPSPSTTTANSEQADTGTAPTTADPNRAEGDGGLAIATRTDDPEASAAPETTLPDEEPPPAEPAPATTEAPPADPAPQTVETVPEDEIEPTTTSVFLAVIATDDALTVQLGEPVDFNVLANDRPEITIDSITVISGKVPGLTLTSGGRLTGVPTELGTSTLVYRLNGTDNSSDTGLVRVTVE